MSTSDFFQCRICRTFFGTLWKAEQHTKRHDEEEGNQNLGTGVKMPVRRRGMLPIQKVTFTNCFVRVVRSQDKKMPLRSKSNCRRRNIPSLNTSPDGDDDTSKEVEEVDKVGRRSRRCKLNADQKLKQVAATLKLAEEVDDASEGADVQFSEGHMKESSTRENGIKGYYDDDEFHPPYHNGEAKKKKRTKSKKASPPPPLTTLNKSPSSPDEASSTKGGSHHKRSKKRRRGGDDKDKNYSAKCDHCPESYPNQKTLAAHIVQSHKEKATNMVICPVSTCKTPILNFRWLLDHLRLHVNAERKELIHSISHPEEKSKSLKKFNPLNYVHSNIFHCKLCLSKQLSFEELKTHQRQAHPEYNLKCPESLCGKEDFDGSVVSLICHVKLTHPHHVDPFKERLKNRFLPKDFKCDKCNYTCDNQRRLDDHIAAIHNKKPKKHPTDEKYALRPFSCPVCKRRFNYRDNLRRHFLLHLDNNPYVCDFPKCDRKLSSAYNLKRHKLLHVESHVKTSRFKCPIPSCGASYSKKGSVVRHLRKHHKSKELPTELTFAEVDRSTVHTRRLPVLPTPSFPSYSEEEIKALRKCQPSVDDNMSKKLSVNENEDNDSVPVLEAQLKHEPKEYSRNRHYSQQIKMEAEDIEEEIHLVDKILLGEDGTAVHIKGEHISPQRKSPLPPANGEIPPATCAAVNEVIQEKVTDKLRKIRVSTVPQTIVDLIGEDPIFKKFGEKDPALTSLKYVRSKKYRYQTEKSFKCPECDEVFTRAWTLQLHMKSQHKKTIIEVFAGNDGDSDPEDGQNRKITFMCGVCAFPAKSREDMAIHLKTHDPDKTNHWKCSKKGCGHIFPNQKKLDIHVNRVHLGSGNYPCQYCKSAFSSKQGLKHHEYKLHQLKKTGERIKKKCPICPAVLATRTYPRHIKKHQNDKEGSGRPMCMLCQDTFSCRMALKRHIDCVHLGKQLKQTGNAASLATARKRKAASIPKKPAEWFDPLLEKIGRNVTDPLGAQTGREKSIPNEGTQNEKNNLEGRDGEADAILGL